MNSLLNVRDWDYSIQSPFAIEAICSTSEDLCLTISLVCFFDGKHVVL